MSFKQSIRFYNDREVRAVWNEEQSKWYFSIVDIVAAITNTYFAGRRNHQNGYFAGAARSIEGC